MKADKRENQAYNECMQVVGEGYNSGKLIKSLH